jgi:hypothetical protein
MKASIKNKLVSSLVKLDKKYPQIANGGCGIFASLLASELTNSGIDFTIHIAHNSLCHQMDAWIAENDSEGSIDLSGIDGFTWEHIYIKVDGKLIDSCGVYDYACDNIKFEDLYASAPISSNMLTQLVASPKRWNSKFDKSKVTSLSADVTAMVKSNF